MRYRYAEVAHLRVGNELLTEDRYARVCRVQRVMRPYIEALVA
jgi:hypothetical protein